MNDKPLINATLVGRNESHATLSIWNRGAHAGRIVVNADDAEAIIEAIDAAQRTPPAAWRPVGDGTYPVHDNTGTLIIRHEGARVRIETADGYWTEFNMDYPLRLCHLASVEALPEPCEPEVGPDWSQAPAWANYWVATSHGKMFWFENEPYFSSHSSSWQIATVHKPWMPNRWEDWPYRLPLGIDWRQTLRRRPGAQE